MTDFITFDYNGVHTASFTEIQASLIEEFKSIYGTDIDVSTASADGVYINTLALMIRNICSCVDSLYSQLDVTSATGKNLDALCALSNVFRRPATYSTAYITVTNVGANSVSLENPVFVDQASKTWKYEGTLTLSSNTSKTILVTCEEIGEVSAPVGWINQTLQTTTLTVVQSQVAFMGSAEESDNSLRARRAQASRITANTTLDSLTAALLAIDGVEDVFIYNNNTSSNILAIDGTQVDAHSVYIIIRMNDRFSGADTTMDETIAKTIHQKLTPGIGTSQPGNNIGADLAKSYTYTEYLYNMTISDADQTIAWKRAMGYTPQINFVFEINQNFILPDSSSDNEIQTIAEYLMSWLNSRSIGYVLTSPELSLQMYNADPLYNGTRTYQVSSVNFSTVNKDTFYNYDYYTYTNNGSTYTLTLTTSI